MIVKYKLERDKVIPLWRETFGDDEAYINAFLELVERKGSFFGAFSESGDLLSMMFVLYIPIRIGKENKKCAYMYACATRSDCRGKGIFKELFSNACSCLEDNAGCDAVYCVPANEELFGFYKKLGFDKALYRRKIYAKNDGKACNVRFEEKHGDDAYSVYANSMPEDMCCVIKSRDVFDLSLKAAEAKIYTFGGGYLIYDGNNVCEIVAPDGNEEALQEAARYFGKNLFAYTFPKKNDREKYAALCVLSNWDFPDNAYANMLMD